MATTLNPYISFQDDAREALEFYRSVLGGELTINTFGEFGQEGTPHADLVMHGQLETEAGQVLMAADTPPGMEYAAGSSITIALAGDEGDRLRGYWEKLSDGATVSVPLEKQMWGDEFGQLTDKFGVLWMVNIAGSGG